MKLEEQNSSLESLIACQLDLDGTPHNAVPLLRFRLKLFDETAGDGSSYIPEKAP